MTLNDISDAVVASLRARLGSAVRSVEPHTGLFDKTELGRFGVNVPAVRVAIVGLGGFGRHSTGECIVPIRFAAVCVAKDIAAAGQPTISRRAAVQALAAAVALAVDFNQFDLSGLYTPDDLAARNQYSSDGDELGLSIWQVTWTTRAVMGTGVDETIAALTQILVNTVTIADPLPVEGADPVVPPTDVLGLPSAARAAAMNEATRALALQETLDEVMFQLAELKRSRANLLRPGTVKSFDAGSNTAVLDVGYETHAVDLGSHTGHWNPLVAGQQIMLLCPDGDASNAMVITGGFLGADKKPSDRADEQVLVPPGAPKDDAALRIRKGGTVLVEVHDITQFKLVVGETAFRIKEDALLPVPKD